MNMNVDAAQFDEPVGAGDDLRLVHATKNGDVGAFEQLVKRYGRKLLRIAQSVTRNKEDSQDAVQEAFLKAFQKLAEFREDSKFSTWLIRITLNQSLMSLRKQRTKKEMSLDEEFQADEDALPLDVPDRGPNPEQLCWASEVRDIFLETLQELRPILRTVFILRDVEGLTIDQTAKVLSVSQAAVKARLWRVRLDLRERLNRRLSERAGFTRREVSAGTSGPHRMLSLFAECLRNSRSQTHPARLGEPPDIASTPDVANPLEYRVSA
jgi:RNA polymerase sigma-70 factor, ECF subfamily